MSPSLVFSALLSTFLGLVFHLLRGGSIARLLLILIAAWIGFGLGQLLGSVLGWSLARIGDVYVLHGLIGSLAAMILASAPAAASPVEKRNTPH